MKLREIYKSDKRVLSFEVFPPDSEVKVSALFDEIRILNEFKPEFISLTRSSNNDNLALAREIHKTLLDEIKTPVIPHFTCIKSNKKDIIKDLENLKELRTKNILALRGDKPEDYDEEKCDFKHANELVKYLNENTDFGIAVAGYPEGHIESEDLESDIKYLKEKVNSGADVIITQMFFDNNKYYNFCEKLEKKGIKIPIIPGIMPILSTKQIDKMTTLAKITIPPKLKNTLEKHSEDKKYIKEFGIEYSSIQCEDLITNEVKGLHFFTLNKAYSTSKILENIKY